MIDLVAFERTQVTVANLLAFWVGGQLLAALLFLRAYDMWVEGDRFHFMIRIGVGLYAQAASFEFLYWMLRWQLLDAGLSDASQWFVANSQITTAFGVFASAGIFVVVASLLYEQMRWNGVMIGAAGVLGTWLVGLYV